jgi:tyrosine-protein kinase Etk/Wzc
MTAINQQRVNEDNESIDIGEVVHTILSNWKVIVICVFVAVVLAILYLRQARFIYSVDGLVQIESSQSSVESLLGNSGLSNLTDLAGVKSIADTEIQLIQSRFVLGAVVHNLNLDTNISSDEDRWFKRLISAPAAQVEYTQNGVTYSRDGNSFTVTQFDVPFSLLDQTFRIEFLANGTYTLNLVTKSNIRGLENQRLMTGKVGQLLTLPLEGGNLRLLIQSNGRDLQTLNSDTVYLTKKSLIQAVSGISSNLSIAEKGKQTGIIALVYQGQDQALIKQTLNEIMSVYLAQNVASRTQDTQKTLSFLDQQLPKLKKELESSEDKYNAFREKNNTIDPTKEAELLLKQGVDLKTKKLELEQQSVLLSQKYTSNFPLVSQIKAQIQAINQNSKELESRVEAMPELQRQNLQLYRDVQVNTVLYTSLLNSYEQLKVLKAGKTAMVRILDQAIISAKPIAPKKPLILVLAALLGGIVSVLFIFLKSILYSGVKDSGVIEARTGVAVIATVPRSLSQRRMWNQRSKKVYLIAKEDPEDFAVESLRSLRTMIHFSLAKSRNNVILITGPAPEIGKSFISANFAVICAQMGKSVILVDVDMRRGHLNKYFDVSDTNGLADYLKGNLDRADLCQPTGISGLDFISKGNSPSNPSELLLTGRFTSLMNELSEKYDYH